MNGSPVCGARTRAGGTCKRAPMPNGRCKLHGGASLAGLASPRFKTGRWSKYLPTRLIDRYEQAQSDTELLAMRDDIALVDARLADLLARVDTGESGSAWRAAREALTDFQTAEGDVERAKRALQDLSRAIGRGLSDYAAWNEVKAVLDARRRLVESERKRLIEMQQMITVERAMLLFAAISDTIKRHVTDRKALAAISADLQRLVTAAPGGGPERGGE